jgi:hypothetical protein
MLQNLFKKYGLYWLIFALLSLSLSGFYSVFVSMMRIPFVFKIFHHPDFFKISLIIHVTLSINIFFILFVFFLWSQDLKSIKKFQFLDHDFLINSALGITGFSILLITISGFLEGAEAHTINYIPVINNLFFFSGISLFFANFFAFGLFYFFSFLCGRNLEKIFKDPKIHLNFFIFFSSFIAFICLASYFLKIKISSSSFDLEEFFWGFGHVLQFTFIELSVLCIYLNFTQNSNFLKIEMNQNFLKILSFFKFGVLIVSPFFYLNENFNEFFTQQMKYGLLIFLIPMNLYFIILLFKTKIILKNLWNYMILGFILSSLLGIFGGETAFFIKEINVMIPAHYHGSLIALTIIVMIFFYGTIERIFFENAKIFFTNKIKNLINLQIILYSIGHFMHVIGLILMGGYGALRKNPGNVSSLQGDQSFLIKFAKYIFFSGSLISISGGLLFIALGFYLFFKLSKMSKTLKIN